MNENPAQASAPSAVQSTSVPYHLGMWDSFQHILLFISLYTMSGAIGLILNYFVDTWIPKTDTIGYALSNSPYGTTIFAGYSAALIVSFPFFVYFFLTTTSRIKKYPELATLKSRKILIYITLVITFIILITQLIATVYGFLAGNISINSAAHFLITLLVAGSIFIYYLIEVRKDKPQNA